MLGIRGYPTAMAPDEHADWAKERTMRRFAGGVVGWLAAALPLLGVNIAGYADVLDTGTAVVAGAAALLGGILLGAVVTGLVAGRPSANREGGAAATLPAGVVAAALYTGSLIAIVEVAIRIQAAPAIVAAHPIRIAGAIICLGAILLGATLIVGTLAGRLATRHHPQPATRSVAPPARLAHPASPSQTRPRYAADPSQPRRGGYPDRSDYHDQRDQRDQRDRRDYGDYLGGQGSDYVGQNGYNDYNEYRNGYNGSDQRQPAPQRSGAPSRPPTRPPSGPASRYDSHSRPAGGRDDDWRDPRR